MALLSKIYFSKKLKATTLIEVLVAMIIILLSFGTGMMIYNNILNSDNGYEKMKSRLILNEIAIETKKEKTFFDEIKEEETFTIHKSIEQYKDKKNLSLLHLKAFNKQGRLIAEKKELIYNL